jgi:hypothetical protein
MKNDTKIPPHNVVHFPKPRRAGSAVSHGGEAPTGDSEGDDQGPSPEESLRLMRAFVRIKNRHLRADLIIMLEGASHTRGPAPVRSKE